MRLSLTLTLQEAVLHVQRPWHWGHRQWQGDRHQENQRRRLGSGGGSQGVSHSAQGDVPPTPVVLAREAASTGKVGRRKGSHASPRKRTEKKMRGDPALHCLTVQLARARARSAGTSGKSRITKRMLPAATLQFWCTSSLRYYYQIPLIIPQYLSASELESVGGTWTCTCTSTQQYIVHCQPDLLQKETAT